MQLGQHTELEISPTDSAVRVVGQCLSANVFEFKANPPAFLTLKDAAEGRGVVWHERGVMTYAGSCDLRGVDIAPRSDRLQRYCQVADKDFGTRGRAAELARWSASACPHLAPSLRVDREPPK